MGAQEAAAEKEEEAVSGPDGDPSTASDAPKDSQQRRTMGDRFRKFGRNVVLPFLDQVVGDKEEDKADEATVVPALGAPLSDVPSESPARTNESPGQTETSGNDEKQG